MRQIYTKKASSNRHPKKYNFERYGAVPVSERRREGIFGPDWFEFNEKHYEEYVAEKKTLGVPDTFIFSWVNLSKEEREAIRNDKTHAYQKYLEILPTEEDIEGVEGEIEEVAGEETITSETNA